MRLIFGCGEKMGLVGDSLWRSEFGVLVFGSGVFLFTDAGGWGKLIFVRYGIDDVYLSVVGCFSFFVMFVSFIGRPCIHGAVFIWRVGRAA